MKPLFCCFLLLACLFCTAQSTVPEFGTFTEEEKKLKECAFDKEADAIVLIDQASSDHDEEHQLITNRRIRIKILKESGIGRGDILIRYYHNNDFEFIRNIEAIICNPDPSGASIVQKVAPSQIFRQKINEYWSAVKFAMPGVKVGSIIEYRYVSTEKNYNGLDDWYFQRDIPTSHSSYSLVILPNFEFAYKVHKSPTLPINIQSEKGSGKILFEMNNVAGLRDEPFMDSERDYIQRVEFQLAGYSSRFGDRRKFMTTWAEVIRELMADPGFGRQMNKNLAGNSMLMNDLKSVNGPFEKMAFIYRFVQNNMTWNGFSGTIYSENVKDAWEKKKGTNSDMNLILINFLQEAGLEVYPLLVSERGHGKVDANYPFIEQFNTVMAFVIIGDNRYVLDAASYGTPAFLIPFSVVNTTGFVVDRKKGGIMQLHEQKKMNKNYINVVGRLDDEGFFSGKGTILSYDYSRINRLRSYHRDKTKFTEDYLVKAVPGMIVDSLDVKNIDNDSLPMDQQFRFKMPVSTTGDYRLLTLNLFSGFEKNPFISDNRFTNIDYGCVQFVLLSQLIEVPEDWQPETLPKDIKLIMPDTSISIMRVMSFDKNNRKLMARYTIQTNRPIFTAEEYLYLKEFYKKMTDLLNEQVVLRKKATP